jgi:hypothetical protein
LRGVELGKTRAGTGKELLLIDEQPDGDGLYSEVRVPKSVNLRRERERERRDAAKNPKEANRNSDIDYE